MRAWVIERRGQVAVTFLMVGLMVFAFSLSALAQVTPNAELGTAITGAADSVEANVLAILPTVLGVAALLMVITIGWRFFRRFVR